MNKLLLVVIGSGFGGGARYLLGGWIQKALGAGFPFGTITINVTGSFLIAFLMSLGDANRISPEVRLALTTGLMGGYTTYSTFNYESLQLFQRGALLLGVLNVLVTVFTALAAGWLGLVVGRWLATA